MLIKTLVSWAGEDMALKKGDLIEVDDAVGLARIEAGLAEAVEAPAPMTPPAPIEAVDAPQTSATTAEAHVITPEKPKRGRPRKRAGVPVETATIEAPESH